MTKLIERNTAIPTKKAQTFSTAADNQTSVDVHVVQGEREMAKDNKTLGRFEMVGIPSAPRGTPQIEVSFDIDANGILSVTAKDLGTGKEQAIKITAKSGLTEAEIKRMVTDAEEHAEEDKNRRERAQIANDLDSLLYSTEKILRDNSNQIDAGDKSKAEEVGAEARKALDNHDTTPTELKEVFERLQSISHMISTAIYEKKAAAGQAGAAGGGAPGGEGEKPKGGEDVIDADYKDVR
jgi:molecular chaperone DnaK